jgi:hypothetical protein
MKTTDLTASRNEIISTITKLCGAENVKNVMQRMIDFLDFTYESCPIAYTRKTIADMKLLKKMESRDGKLVKIFTDAEEKGLLEL